MASDMIKDTLSSLSKNFVQRSNINGALGFNFEGLQVMQRILTCVGCKNFILDDDLCRSLQQTSCDETSGDDFDITADTSLMTCPPCRDASKLSFIFCYQCSQDWRADSKVWCHIHKRVKQVEDKIDPHLLKMLISIRSECPFCVKENERISSSINQIQFGNQSRYFTMSEVKKHISFDCKHFRKLVDKAKIENADQFKECTKCGYLDFENHKCKQTEFETKNLKPPVLFCGDHQDRSLGCIPKHRVIDANSKESFMPVLYEVFKCTVCSNLPFVPVKCPNCSVLYCRDCILYTKDP